MQRGGSPTCKDRVYASTMGALAVDVLLEGKTKRVIGYKNGDMLILISMKLWQCRNPFRNISMKSAILCHITTAKMTN